MRRGRGAAPTRPSRPDPSWWPPPLPQSSPNPPGSKPAKDPKEVRQDAIRGCKTVMAELQGGARGWRVGVVGLVGPRAQLGKLSRRFRVASQQHPACLACVTLSKIGRTSGGGLPWARVSWQHASLARGLPCIARLGVQARADPRGPPSVLPQWDTLHCTCKRQGVSLPGATLVACCAPFLPPGLDFGRADVRGYFQFVVKPPAGVAKDYDLSRPRVRWPRGCSRGGRGSGVSGMGRIAAVRVVHSAGQAGGGGRRLDAHA